MTNTNTVKTNVNDGKPSPSLVDKWLDEVCPVIKQSDFDTCRNSYNDGQYDTCNGYRQAYNTYLDQFENC